MGFMGIPRETWCVCRKEKGLVKGSRYSNNGALDPQAPEFEWSWASKTFSSAYGLDLLIQVFRVSWVVGQRFGGQGGRALSPGVLG